MGRFGLSCAPCSGGRRGRIIGIPLTGRAKMSRNPVHPSYRLVDPDGRRYIVCEYQLEGCGQLSDEDFTTYKATMMAQGLMDVPTGSAGDLDAGHFYSSQLGGWVGAYQQLFRDSIPVQARGPGPSIGPSGGGKGGGPGRVQPSQELIPRRLTRCEMAALGPYIPSQDLANARIYNGVVPFWLGEDFIGLTLGNEIYFRPGAFDPSKAAGLGLVGHELVHVGQFRNGETVMSFAWSYIRALGYWGSPLEDAARQLQNRITNDLLRNGTTCRAGAP
jgi:hypothetical protein